MTTTAPVTVAPATSAPGSAISLYARPSADFSAKVERTLGLMRDAVTEHPGRIVQATSLGAEDMVLTDLIASHALPIAIGTLETGMLHAETVALIGRIEARYQLAVEAYRPRQEAVVQFVKTRGDDVPQHRAAQGLLRHPQARASVAHAGRALGLGHRPAPRAE